jgi:hypothetical protein
LYSNYSPASKALLSYIKELPLDFPKVTGMSMICIDNERFKETLQKNGIEYVPTLLVEYYQGVTPNQVKQKFERDYIYMWIDQVMSELPQTSQAPDKQSVRPGGAHRTDLSSVGRQGQQSASAGRSPALRPSVAESEVVDIPPPPQDDVPQIQKKEKVDITALAQQMAKDRDSYISDTTPTHKKK